MMSLFLLRAIALVIAIAEISADRSIVVLLNNGVADITAGSCTDEELAKTDAIITASGLNSTYGKRQLRGFTEDLDDMTKTMAMIDKEHRALPSYPRKCKDLCAGVASGYCLEVNCKGYRRRRRRRDLLGNHDDRHLLSGAAFTCTEQVSYINSEINKLVSQSQVSDCCKTLLSKPRAVTCFDDVIYGVVENFKVIDTIGWPQKVISLDFTGGDICIHQNITFESVTNDCVDSVLTALRGPNNYYSERHEYFRPFSVFGDTGAAFLGQKLPFVGQYELTALPDGLIEKKKVVTFNAVGGTVAAVKLWDTAAKNVMSPNFTGGNVCNTKTIGFEVVLSCGISSRFTLTSSNGFSHSHTESVVPLSVFGDVGGVINGRNLWNGSYTLTIYPDQIVNDKVRIIQFNVINC